MNFLKSFLSITHREKPESVSPLFAQDVKKAIILINNASNQITDKEVLTLFGASGIAPMEAEEILLFLPVAFVRHLLPKISWPDYYSEMHQDKTQTKKYMASPFYQVIWDETGKYFQQFHNSETIIKIAGRSAEFNYINGLLLGADNEVDFNNIKVSPTVVIR